MARATVIVETWIVSIGWQYYKGYPADSECLALLHAVLLECFGVPARVYRRTPDGPEVIYESPKED